MVFTLNEMVSEISKNLLDWTDKETLDKITSVNENDQFDLVTKATNEIYNSFLSKMKSTKIDLGTIPLSKGDITKLAGEYNSAQLSDVINVLNQTKAKLHLKGKAIDTITLSYNNLVKYRKIFMEGFSTKNTILMNLYNFCVLTICRLSCLIGIALREYFTELKPTISTKEYDALDKHSLTNTLTMFNKLVTQDGFKKILKINTNAPAKSGIFGTIAALGVGAAVLALIYNSVSILRELVYYFLFVKASVSDYFFTQATMLDANATKLAALDNKNPDQQDTADAQKKFADTFRKIANSLRVDDINSTNKAEKAMEKDSATKLTYEELNDSQDDDNSSIF